MNFYRLGYNKVNSKDLKLAVAKGEELFLPYGTKVKFTDFIVWKKAPGTTKTCF